MAAASPSAAARAKNESGPPRAGREGGREDSQPE